MLPCAALGYHYSNDFDFSRHLEAYHEIISESHKPLYPLDATDLRMFSFAAAGLLLAAGGGIGGGGMLVPIYCLVGGFSPKHAIPLSNVTVLGGALANTCLNWSKKLGNDKPLLDWDLILAMEPLTIAGALLGALLNKVLPETVLTVMLVLLLTVTAHKTGKKALKLYQKESQEYAQESELTRMARQQEHEGEDDSIVEDHDQEADEFFADDDVPYTKEQAQERKEKQDLLEAIQYAETKTPWHNVTVLLVLFVVVLAINLAKGGGAMPSPLGISCGSTSFWMANLALLAWILGVAVYARQILMSKHEAKLWCRYPYRNDEIQWNSTATWYYPVVCCLAGFFAGMFGIGGGIVKGPLMLAMGIPPAVSSASSACMILLTSFTATTSFIVFGLLVSDYAIACILLGFCATIVGQLGLAMLMRRAGGRPSYIAFSIAAVVLVSAVLMTIQSVLSMASGEHHHAGGICGPGD